MDDDAPEPTRPLSREDLEIIRRSLAIASTLPATDGYRLLAENRAAPRAARRTMIHQLLARPD